MHSHFPRDVREDLMTIIELYTKHRIGEGFQYRSLNFNNVFLRHEPLSFPLTFHHPNPLQVAEYERRAVRLNCDRMLKMRREAPVDRHRCPAVIQHPNGRASHVNHRLDGQDHAGL